MKGCTIVFLAAILRAMASCATKATPGHASAVLYSVAVLVTLKALSNVATSIKRLAIMQLAIEQEAYINKSIDLLKLYYPNI